MTLFRSIALVSALAFCAALITAGREIIPSPGTVSALYQSAGLAACAMLAELVRAYAFKVGGLTFLRLGRLSLSFCITRH